MFIQKQHKLKNDHSL